MMAEPKVVLQVSLYDDGNDTLNIQSTSKNDITNLGMLQRAIGLIQLRSAVKQEDSRIQTV